MEVKIPDGDIRAHSRLAIALIRKSKKCGRGSVSAGRPRSCEGMTCKWLAVVVCLGLCVASATEIEIVQYLNSQEKYGKLYACPGEDCFRKAPGMRRP